MNRNVHACALGNWWVLSSLQIACIVMLIAKSSHAMEGFDVDDIAHYQHHNHSPVDHFLSPFNQNQASPAITPGKFARVDTLREKYEAERVSMIFANLDELFMQAIIRYQTVDKHGRTGPEQSSNLLWYLSAPHDKNAIVNLIEKSLYRTLQNSEQQLLDNCADLSFSKAVRVLWHHKIISEKRAQELLSMNTPISSEELVRLLENGVVETAKGYLIKLRTGSTFGEPMKLFDDIAQIINGIKAHHLSDSDEAAFSKLLEKPIPPEILDVFSEAGIKAEETISDANVIREIREHFLFLNSLGLPIRFNPSRMGFHPIEVASPPVVNTENSIRYSISPETLSASLVGNYYFSSENASMTHGLYVNPLGITYAGMLTFENNGLDWWLNYSSGFLGAGLNYTTTFDQGTFWSNGDPTYLNVGIMAGGWNNYLTGGLSLSTVLANGVGVGVTATMTVTRSHDVSYLGTEPLDSMIPAIRGLHKIEIDDIKGIAANASVAANFSALDVPVTVAFLASAERTTRRLYRTHADFPSTQRMLSEADVPGVLYLLGKRIKETRIPSFEHPEILIDGDELVETKIGKLNGAFIVGLESLIPIHALRVGTALELTAEYELGIKKYSNSKYEVSIQPKRVYEIGLFGSLLNVMGLGYIKSFAMAKKQIFAFDFNYPEAIIAYQDLIHQGNLPITEDVAVYTENRGPEYLLNDFRAQNQALKQRGVARTYLEKIDIETSKWHAGIDVPILPAILDIVNKVDQKTRKNKERLDIQFSGIYREFMSAESKSLATNGITAIRRSTFGGRKSKGQGFSGVHNEDVFVTHERVHSLDPISGVNTWGFNRLVVHAQFEDTRITGNEENQMVEHINRLFSTFIGAFTIKNSKAPRLINLERVITPTELHALTQSQCRDRAGVASQKTGIDHHKITAMLKSLKNKHPDYQGLVVKHFIETSPGVTGFAAIHQLLGAQPDQIYVRTESGYGDEILQAKKFIVTYTKGEHEQGKYAPFINVEPFDIHKNKKHARNFYNEGRIRLREIDDQLRLLHDDRYLVDEQSLLYRLYPDKHKVKQLVAAGFRQDKEAFRTGLTSARKTILEMRDLEAQGFSKEDQALIYKMAGKKRVGIRDLAKILLMKYERTPLSPSLTRGHLKKRFKKCREMITELNDRIFALQSDAVMIAMDKEYVSNTIHEFATLRKRLSAVISAKHLSEHDREKISAKIAPKTHCWSFHKKSAKNLESVFVDLFADAPVVCDLDDCTEDCTRDDHDEQIAEDLRKSSPPLFE